MKNYEKFYFIGICKDSIRKELNIPESDKLKKNGTFKRGVYYVENNDLRYQEIKIQTLLWVTASGKKNYISVFPSCIVKYNKVSSDLIELISTSVGKGESVFYYIDDSGNLLESEDILIRSCERINKAVVDNKFVALLNAKYTETFNNSILSFSIQEYMKLNLLFKETFVLLKAAIICSEALILKCASLTYLNEFFKFLR